MKRAIQQFAAALVLVKYLLVGDTLAESAKFRSHPPTRPLPIASNRPMADGPALYVDAVRGDDGQDGSKDKPWRTLAHAAKQLKAGTTLYLRGGTYYEHAVVSVVGTLRAPITIRSYPGELAVIDGGLREFAEQPDKAWEPCTDGVAGEYRSTRTYPDLGGSAGGTNVMGLFGDSLLPLHGYRFLSDLRSRNIFFNLKVNTADEPDGIYCGPGVYYDVKSGRIHVRLAYTNMPYLDPGDNYQGETDPRKLPLVVAGLADGPPLTIRGSYCLRVQDVTVRGARTSAIEVAESSNIELDGVTAYGGYAPIAVRETTGFRLLHSACRGIAAPWTFRGSLKYRAVEARLFSASGWTPAGRENQDFELAYSEFTDSVDGIFIGNVKKVRLHHCLLDNVSDDGVFLTAGTGLDGQTPGGDVHIYQNLLSRCLTTFAFGVGRGRQKALPKGIQTGAGVSIFRNVFDMRRPVLYHQPSSASGPQEITYRGRFACDHGSPIWEPMFIYHNTLIMGDAASQYGAFGLGDHVAGNSARRIFNNVIVQLSSMPGATYPPVTANFQADGNLFWSPARGPAFTGDLFTKFRQSEQFEASRQSYPPGWGASDRFADPKFVALVEDWRKPIDLRLQTGSPALNSGVALPADWPDPLGGMDDAKPDRGALPHGVNPWHVGIGGRLSIFGEAKRPMVAPRIASMQFSQVWPAPATATSDRKPAVIVQGYPPIDTPLIELALRRQGVPVEILRMAWLDPKLFDRFGTVVYTANLGDKRGGATERHQFTEADLPQVQRYLENGGTLLLTRGTTSLFATDHGQKFLQNLIGFMRTRPNPRFEILLPNHPWVKGLRPRPPVDLAVPPDPLDNKKPAVPPAPPAVASIYLNPKATVALAASKGERIIGSRDGVAVLYRLPVGSGQLIYVGWDFGALLPSTRRTPATLDQESAYEDQLQVLFRIAEDLYPSNSGR